MKTRMASVGSRACPAIVLLLNCAAANAQAALPPPAPTPLGTVVVTATRSAEDPLLVPAAIDRIDAADLHRAQPGIDLSEALQRVPGVVARDRQNDAQDLQISVRGFGARATFGVRGVRLYTDGIPATMPDGQGQVSHFELESARPHRSAARAVLGAVRQCLRRRDRVVQRRRPPAQPQVRLGVVAGSDRPATCVGVGCAGRWRRPAVGYSLDARACRHRRLSRRTARRARDSGQATAARRRSPAARATRCWPTASTCRPHDPQGLTRGAVRRATRAPPAPARCCSTPARRVRQQQLGAARSNTTSTPASASPLAGYAGDRQTAQMLSVPVAAQASPLSGGGVIDLDRDYRGVDARWRWSPQLPAAARADRRRRSATSRTSTPRLREFIGDALGVRGALRRDERDRVTGSDQYLQAAVATRRALADRSRRCATARVRFDSRDRYVTADNPDDSGRARLSRDHRRWPACCSGVTPCAAACMPTPARGFETPTFNELAYRADGRSGLNYALRPARSTQHRGRPARAHAAATRMSARRVPQPHQRRTGGRRPTRAAAAIFAQRRPDAAAGRRNCRLAARSASTLALRARLHLARRALPRRASRLRGDAVHRRRTC